MRAGDLREVISIYRRSIERDEYGSDITVDVMVSTTRAQYIVRSGGRSISVDEVADIYTIELIVRHYISIIEGDIVEYRGKKYKVLSVIDDRPNMLKRITAETLNQ